MHTIKHGKIGLFSLNRCYAANITRRKNNGFNSWWAPFLRTHCHRLGAFLLFHRRIITYDTIRGHSPWGKGDSPKACDTRTRNRSPDWDCFSGGTEDRGEVPASPNDEWWGNSGSGTPSSFPAHPTKENQMSKDSNETKLGDRHIWTLTLVHDRSDCVAIIKFSTASGRNSFLSEGGQNDLILNECTGLTLKYGVL